MATVRRIQPEDGSALRDVRLRALLDSPTAYAMSYAEESTYPESHWDECAERWSASTTEVTFLAEVDDDVVGMVGGFEQDPTVFQLVAMWVAPHARRSGVGRDLVDALVSFASGWEEVRLWVTDDNRPATELYLAAGFDFDGPEQPLPSHPHLTERQMVRPTGP